MAFGFEQRTCDSSLFHSLLLLFSENLQRLAAPLRIIRMIFTRLKHFSKTQRGNPCWSPGWHCWAAMIASNNTHIWFDTNRTCDKLADSAFVLLKPWIRRPSCYPVWLSVCLHLMRCESRWNHKNHLVTVLEFSSYQMTRSTRWHLISE